MEQGNSETPYKTTVDSFAYTQSVDEKSFGTVDDHVQKLVKFKMLMTYVMEGI